MHDGTKMLLLMMALASALFVIFLISIGFYDEAQQMLGGGR